MKTILTFVMLHLCLLGWAQVPQGITYQAVVRDAEGNIRAEETVTLTLTILEESPTGAVVYEEFYTPTTNKAGLVNLVVGEGTVNTGTFSGIDWSQGNLFIRVSLDGLVISTRQLLTVPFAFHAQTVETVDLDYSEVGNAPTRLSEFADDLGVITATDLVDNDAENELQTLSLSGNTLSLSKGGGSIELPGASRRSLVFPAQALNVSPTSTVIQPSGTGLRWSNDFANSASIAVRKPADYAGGAVRFYILFQTTSAAAGTVAFFIRPRSYDSGDGFNDVINLDINEVSVSGSQGFGTLYEQSYEIPASSMQEDWWYISIQRDNSGPTYTDDVIAFSVALEYAAN